MIFYEVWETFDCCCCQCSPDPSFVQFEEDFLH